MVLFVINFYSITKLKIKSFKFRVRRGLPLRDLLLPWLWAFQRLPDVGGSRSVDSFRSGRACFPRKSFDVRSLSRSTFELILCPKKSKNIISWQKSKCRLKSFDVRTPTRSTFDNILNPEQRIYKTFFLDENHFGMKSL